MRGRTFIDTNVLLYFISDHAVKKAQARDAIFLSDAAVVSSQVINEFIAVCLKKSLLGLDAASDAANDFMKAMEFCTVTASTINKAISIVRRHKYSYWDSLIAATAMENGCSVLYTEDMQNGQVIDSKLKIVNPFAQR